MLFYIKNHNLCGFAFPFRISYVRNRTKSTLILIISMHYTAIIYLLGGFFQMPHNIKATWANGAALIDFI